MNNESQRPRRSKRRGDRKTPRPVNPRNPAIAQLGLDPDLYDANGSPIAWTDPQTGTMFGGDPKAFAMDGTIQVLGNYEAMARGGKPRMRPMTLDDLDDDCPVCRANRKRIEAGDPPIVLAYD
jgi:hypothetical protein